MQAFSCCIAFIWWLCIPDDDELEQAMITVGNHIEAARSMRELLDFLHAQAQKCTEDSVDDEEM
ncbi:MAG: hypothetical protein ACI90V_014169 [Bacillariaceae sp.]|jgi:hypothetical protein